MPVLTDDAQELLDTDFISTFAKKAPYCWEIKGTNFALYQRQFDSYAFELFESLDDGDERTWCIVRTRGQCRLMVEKLTGVVVGQS
jgi:DNA-binding ferritin-like protein